jgi:hypothetical protein
MHELEKATAHQSAGRGDCVGGDVDDVWQTKVAD